jgi:hypothetical protein
VKVGILQGADGQIVQVTEPREPAKKRLAMLEIEPPPPVLQMQAAAAAT